MTERSYETISETGEDAGDRIEGTLVPASEGWRKPTPTTDSSLWDTAILTGDTHR